MPNALLAYLQFLDKDFKVTSSTYNFTQLIIAAKQQGIKIVPIDTSVSYDTANAYLQPDDNDKERYSMMNYVSAQQIEKCKKEDKSLNKYAVLCGSGHAKELISGIPGLSEITGSPAILVVDTDKNEKENISVKPTGWKAKPDILIRMDGTKVLTSSSPQANTQEPHLTISSTSSSTKNPLNTSSKTTGTNDKPLNSPSKTKINTEDGSAGSLSKLSNPLLLMSGIALVTIGVLLMILQPHLGLLGFLSIEVGCGLFAVGGIGLFKENKPAIHEDSKTLWASKKTDENRRKNPHTQSPLAPPFPPTNTYNAHPVPSSSATPNNSANM